MLAGIILSNVVPYLETIYNLPTLWRQDQYECVSTDAPAELGLEQSQPELTFRQECRAPQHL